MQDTRRSECRASDDPPLRLASRQHELGIRPARWDDAEAMHRVAALHMELLDYGPMAGLGERFIRRAIYEQHLRDGSLRAALYEVAGRAVGFVAYTDQPWTFHRVTLRRHWPRTAWILFTSLLREPGRVLNLWRAMRVTLSRRGEVQIARDGVGEVVCIAVQRAYLAPRFARESGRRLSEDLVAYAACELGRTGLDEMRMLVDADNREVLFLYHRLGARFERYTQAGEPMVNVWFDLRSPVFARALAIEVERRAEVSAS